MGQGLFTAVVFGRLHFDPNKWDLPDDISEEDRKWAAQYGIADIFYERLCEVLGNEKYETSYECEKSFFGFPVAVDDGFLQEKWDLPDIDYEKVDRLCKPRDATYISGDYCDRSEIDARWQKVKDLAKQFGMDLPNGSFMLVRDWD